MYTVINVNKAAAIGGHMVLGMAFRRGNGRPFYQRKSYPYNIFIYYRPTIQARIFKFGTKEENTSILQSYFISPGSFFGK
jgi:hypothetical protein